MDRWVVLLALAACEPTRVSEPPPAVIAWEVPPAPGGFPLGPVMGRLGRSQAPQPLVELGIAAAPGTVRRGREDHDDERERKALERPTIWPVPGDGPARAVASGSEGDHPAIELIDIDAGRVVWRDAKVCAAPVVGVTADVIVCADAHGTRGITTDGAPRWATTSLFVAFTGGRVVVRAAGAAGVAIVLDTADGAELARIALPARVVPDAIVASCGRGHELLAVSDDGKLVRIVNGFGGAAVVWAVPLGAVVEVDGCDRETVVVREAGPGGPSLVAIARSTGKITGRIDGVAGWWEARDGTGHLEVATATGVASYPRDLVGPPTALALPALGELIASRGAHRLVRATRLTAALLDRAGVRGYLPIAELGAVLGDRALVAAAIGAPGATLHRRALPPPGLRPLRLPPQHRGVALDAELRDLPPVLPLDAAGAVAQADTGRHGVAALAIDPGDGAAVYAIALDGDGERSAVARADLAARTWRWQRVDGCGPGPPVALAVAREVVVCGAAGALPDGARATVRATSRDGAARWQWITDHIDGVAAAGDVVVVHDADQLTVLDARDGRVRGHVASDDGAAARAAVVALGDATLVITVERGRVVARLGIGGLLPLWSVAVAGAVRALAASGDGVLVLLEDGDAYRIDARTAAITALPGLGLAWHATGEIVTGHTVGGPIPGPPPPPPPLTAAQLLRRPLQILHGEVSTPPPMSTPIKPPPALGDSWQLTLYELGGGLRARNDYAFPAPVAPPAPRGPPGSPLVIAYGPGLHEVAVLDPRSGDPLRRVRLPDDAPAAVFGTVVDGSPVAGALLGSPLRVVLF